MATTEELEKSTDDGWGNVTSDLDPFIQFDGSDEFAERLERKLQRIRFGASGAAAARRQRRAPSEKTAFKSLYKQMSCVNSKADQHSSKAAPAARQQGSMLVTPAAPDAGIPTAADKAVPSGSSDEAQQFAPDGMALIFAEAALAGPGAWQDAMHWHASQPEVEASFQPLVPELPHAAVEGSVESSDPPCLPSSDAAAPSVDDDLLTGGATPPPHQPAAHGSGQPSAATAAQGAGAPDPEHVAEGATSAPTLGSIPWKLEPSNPPQQGGHDDSSCDSDDEGG